MKAPLYGGEALRAIARAQKVPRGSEKIWGGIREITRGYLSWADPLLPLSQPNRPNEEAWWRGVLVALLVLLLMWGDYRVIERHFLGRPQNGVFLSVLIFIFLKACINFEETSNTQFCPSAASSLQQSYVNRSATRLSNG